ncbi:cobalt ECF transporter T component CbiQ [Methanosarcina sp.]|jgi:cobalt/nickel transport system permease protein|uniref:cobalt ECF transporter T component CbiQ n=1 Tax=Methanosarcina sp. TaxID=2213 RepID=UPI002B890850|nr:cobalt ECF transporter T component CbiQ [Methanosarcina sp.]HOW15180.1 cobalt ECF transporter T component CbiQ [Methanosarcina sp.]
MTNILDDYALMSPLRHRNNWLKLAIVFFGLLAGVSSTSPITPLFIALCMSFATVGLGNTPIKLYFKLLLAPMGFAVIGVLIIAFFSGSGPEMLAFELLGYPLSIRTDGFELALLVLSRSISGMCCLYFLALSTPMIELFAVLKASRLPESLIELSMLIYRYIFVFLDMAICIRYAQTVRLGYSNFKRSINSLGMLASTLFIRSWEQGDKLFLAMNSRCYDGKMTLFEVHRPVKASELLLTSAYFLSTLALFYFTKNISIV